MTIVLCQRNARSQAEKWGCIQGTREDTNKKWMDSVGFFWQLFVLFMLGVRGNVEYLEMAVAWFVSGSDPSNDPGCDPWHPWRKGIENPMLYFLNTSALYATLTTQ